MSPQRLKSAAWIVVLFVSRAIFAEAPAVTLQPPRTLRLDQIHMRDPFVLPVKEDGKYYLFGTANFTQRRGLGFIVYSSRDLTNWEGPEIAFRRPPDFWGEHQFWAPEVHRYHDRYYMLATFIGTGHERGTAVLVSDRPQGPYVPHSNGAITPTSDSCLDGTLFIENDVPWMVYSHEFTQIQIGAICAIRMKPDLSAAEGSPVELFRASDAPWAKHWHNDGKSLVTDGPFLHRLKNGSLIMLWSSFGGSGDKRVYCLGVARSESGKLQGPWKQEPAALYEDDGGHGMIFDTFDGETVLSLHQPNSNGEHPRLFALAEEGGKLALGQEVGVRQDGWEVNDMKRPVPATVTPGEQVGMPPSDANVLFDGKDLSKWESEKGDAAPWTVDNGILEIKPHTGYIHTKQEFGDCQLHVEWQTPPDVKGDGQARGNSGVFLMGLYEIQVLDTLKNRTYADGMAGSIYGQYPPLANAARPAGQWQTYDIVFRHPRLDPAGAVKEPAVLTVFFNGVLVQDHMPVLGPTQHHALTTYPATNIAKGPLALQDHGDIVHYRNIWIREIPEEKPVAPVRSNSAEH